MKNNTYITVSQLITDTGPVIFYSFYKTSDLIKNPPQFSIIIDADVQRRQK